MTLDAEWAGAIASIASALVVALAAIAAFLQLRHVRNANDIVVYLRLIDRMDSTEGLTARRTVGDMRARFDSDVTYRERMTDPHFIPDDFMSIGELLRFLEHIAVLVTKGGVAEELLLAEYADTFVELWDNLRPIIVQRRIAYGPYTGRAFEHLAMRAKHYIDSGAMEREYNALLRDTRPAKNRQPDESTSLR